MAFYAIEAFTSKPDLIDNPYPTTFNCHQKAAVILDIALAAIGIGIGACVLLQAKGILDLGMFSSIGTISPQTAKIMIAAGLGLLTLDFMKMTFQQVSYANEMIALVGQMQTDLNEADARIAQITEHPQHETEESNDEDQTAPISEIQEQAEEAPLLRQQLEEAQARTAQFYQIQEQLRATQEQADRVPILEGRIQVLESSKSASEESLMLLEALNGEARTILDTELKEQINGLERALEEAHARIEELEKDTSNSSLLAPISLQHSSRFGQTVFADKADENTDVQSDRMVGEKSGPDITSPPTVTTIPPLSPPPAPPAPIWNPASEEKHPTRAISIADQIQARALELASKTIDAAAERSSNVQRYFESMENVEERSELLQILREHFLNKLQKLSRVRRRIPQNALMRAVTNRRKSISDNVLDASFEKSPCDVSLLDTIHSRAQIQAGELAEERWENGEDDLDEEAETMTLEEQKRAILDEHKPVFEFYMATAAWYNSNVPREQKLDRVQAALDTINNLIEIFDGDAND